MKYRYCDHSLTEMKKKELENYHTINVLETKLVFLEKENSIIGSALKMNKKQSIRT